MDATPALLRPVLDARSRQLQPGMVTATIGLALFVLVTVSSITLARRHLRYEHWYWVHLTAYAAIALAWFHQIPTGGDINPAFHSGRHDLLARALLRHARRCSSFRVLTPVWSALPLPAARRGGDRRGAGRHLDPDHRPRLERLRARPGQFFLWRFLTRGFWWTAHPFSLSAAPDGRSLRISVKAAGDHTRRMRDRSPSARASSPRAPTARSPRPCGGGASRC